MVIVAGWEEEGDIEDEDSCIEINHYGGRR